MLIGTGFAQCILLQIMQSPLKVLKPACLLFRTLMKLESAGEKVTCFPQLSVSILKYLGTNKLIQQERSQLSLSQSRSLCRY